MGELIQSSKVKDNSRFVRVIPLAGMYFSCILDI